MEQIIKALSGKGFGSLFSIATALVVGMVITTDAQITGIFNGIHTPAIVGLILGLKALSIWLTHLEEKRADITAKWKTEQELETEKFTSEKTLEEARLKIEQEVDSEIWNNKRVLAIMKFQSNLKKNTRSGFDLRSIAAVNQTVDKVIHSVVNGEPLDEDYNEVSTLSKEIHNDIVGLNGVIIDKDKNIQQLTTEIKILNSKTK